MPRGRANEARPAEPRPLEAPRFRPLGNIVWEPVEQQGRGVPWRAGDAEEMLAALNKERAKRFGREGRISVFDISGYTSYGHRADESVLFTLNDLKSKGIDVTVDLITFKSPKDVEAEVTDGVYRLITCGSMRKVPLEGKRVEAKHMTINKPYIVRGALNSGVPCAGRFPRLFSGSFFSSKTMREHLEWIGADGRFFILIPRMIYMGYDILAIKDVNGPVYVVSHTERAVEVKLEAR